MAIKGRASVKGISVSAVLPPYEPDQEIDLGKFFPAAKGFRLNGRFACRADLVLNTNSKHAAGRLEIANGRLSQSENAIVLSGISGALVLKQLPALRSEPEQQLRVSRLEIGNLVAEDLQVNYQIEPPGTFFIERADLKWCQGTSIPVHTPAAGCQPTRCHLVLQPTQSGSGIDPIGCGRGSGQGSVNGRIPLAGIMAC